MDSSTIPPDLLDSAAGRVATMNSVTIFACEDGTVLGTEGNGCCPVNCTHVYGYTTLMERLFPTLAKNLRTSCFVRNFDLAQGGCVMRFGTGGWAIDGALAEIIKTLLVVQQSDPTLSFLGTVWANVKAQMDSIVALDTKADGVLTCDQFNTYDTAMSGSNTFIGSYYVAGLRSCAVMAGWMGDDGERASEQTQPYLN